MCVFFLSSFVFECVWICLLACTCAIVSFLSPRVSFTTSTDTKDKECTNCPLLLIIKIMRTNGNCQCKKYDWQWDESGLLEFFTLLHSRPRPAKECREDSGRGICNEQREKAQRKRHLKEVCEVQECLLFYLTFIQPGSPSRLKSLFRERPY